MTDADVERVLGEALTRTLAENGITATAPDGLHSWRCEYPDRYGPCDCLAELVTDLAAVLAPLLDQARAQGWDEGIGHGERSAWVKAAHADRLVRENPYLPTAGMA